MLKAGEIGYVGVHIDAFGYVLILEWANHGSETVEGFIKSRFDVGVVFLHVSPGVEIDDMGIIRLKGDEDAPILSAQNSWNKPSSSAIKEIHERM